VVKEDVNADVRQFILKTFPRARKQHVKDDDALIERGMLDSLGILEVVSFIEKRFAISVADDDLVPEHFETIDRIGSYIQSRTNPNSAS
jgi:acyl carrier protein